MLMELIIGVFKLDANTFEEIEHDQDATTQAALIVSVVALIGAIGNGISASLGGEGFFGAFFSGLIGTLVGWVVWSLITYFVGTSMFDGVADVGEMLRVIGFAYVPQVLGIIPCIGTIVGALWTLAAGFVAVRQGLDFDNTKAFFTIAIGFVAYMIVIFLVGLALGGGALALDFLTSS